MDVSNARCRAKLLSTYLEKDIFIVASNDSVKHLRASVLVCRENIKSIKFLLIDRCRFLDREMYVDVFGVL